MSSLTTMLLADAIDKGGPGSGPHGGSGSNVRQLSAAARAASNRANKTGAKEDHIAAVNAHMKAADAANASGSAGRFGSSMSHIYNAEDHAHTAGGKVNYETRQFQGRGKSKK